MDSNTALPVENHEQEDCEGLVGSQGLASRSMEKRVTDLEDKLWLLRRRQPTEFEVEILQEMWVEF